MKRSRVLAFACLIAAVSACGGSRDEVASFDEFLFSAEAAEAAAVGDARREEAMRVCMEDQGFEYTPFSRAVPESSRQFWRSGVAVNVDDPFTAEHGYGVTVFALETRAVFAADPNRAYVESLDAPQRSAYGQASAACSVRQVEENRELIDVVTELNQRLADLDQRILADPALADHIAVWSECMAERGHRFSTLSEPKAFVEVTVNAYLETLDGPVAPSDATVAELKRAEVALALDDAECRVPFMAQLMEVRDRLESAFLDDNASLMERYVDALR